MLLYVDDSSMSYLKATAKAPIKVIVKLSGQYKIMNLCPTPQFLGNEIHHHGMGFTLGQKASIATIH
jgi:hypothetical protein